MRKSSTLAVLTILLLLTPWVQAGEAFDYGKHVFDFGNVAIDFTMFHRYAYVNPTDHPVKILEADANCDCTTLKLVDSLIEPGDTAFFDLSFNTRDYYGYTSKSFTVVTDDPEIGTFKFYYVSTIGQWLNALKPNPISLFFLPGKKGQKLAVPNVKFDKIELKDYILYDSTFSVKVLNDSARQGKNLELEVTASDQVGKGSHLSTLTLEIEVSGQEKPTILSIPVKIVRY